MAVIGPHYSFPETSMRDFYNILFRQKKKMVIFFLSVMAIVLLGIFLGPRVYKSESELLVRIGRENATVGPTVATGKVININQDRENEINSEADILKSRELAEKVTNAVGASLILNGAKETPPVGASFPEFVRYYVRRAAGYPFKALGAILRPGESAGERMLEKDLAIVSLMKHLDVQVSKKSDLITISYETNDPALARTVLSRLMGFYLEKHIEANRTPGSYQFFKRQKNKLRSALNRTEEELKDLKDKTAVASISEQRRILLERLGAMRRELENTQSSLAASQARVKVLTGTLAGLPSTVRKDKTTGFANSAADELRKKVYELELKEQKLLSTFTENSIPVQEIRRRIEHGKALLLKSQQQDQVTTGINENHQKIEFDLLTEKANLSSLQARAEAIRSQLKSGAASLEALNDTEKRFAQLDLDLAAQRANYLKYSDSLEQARIDEALDMQRISNISIVEPATYSVKPVRPQKLLDLALGLFLGISGALGLAFFSEFQDHSLKKPEDVDNRLHLPLLATLARVAPQKGLPCVGPAGKGAIRAECSCEWLLGCNGKSAAIGAFLRPGAGASVPGAIALTGCHWGEGVSTTAALLAHELAQRGEGRILLMDANPLRPCQHLKFGIPLSPGLTDFGSNGGPNLRCIQPTALEDLDILSAGKGRLEPAINVVKAVSAALPALRREYSFIICDLPPLLEQGLALDMASLMDGVVLIVEAEKTRWEVVNKAREALIQADSAILGVILNKRRFHIPEWIYKTL